MTYQFLLFVSFQFVLIRSCGLSISLSICVQYFFFLVTLQYTRFFIRIRFCKNVLSDFGQLNEGQKMKS